MVSNENNSADTGNIIPNAKTKRYDRQLRIWGMHGQTALENAQICLLHSGPTGSETLKNLVLGGIGGFTIVDDAIVSSRDLGNNFMLAASQLGRARAAAVSDNLKELNDAVEGSYVDTNPHQLIDEQPTFFERFNLVIATQLEETYAHKLDDICRGANVPLLLARSYGLIGSVRVCVFFGGGGAPRWCMYLHQLLLLLSTLLIITWSELCACIIGIISLHNPVQSITLYTDFYGRACCYRIKARQPIR